jgi:SdrD B-like domain
MDVATATDPLDSDADLATGKTGVYTLVAGDSNMTVDAGFYKPALPAEIGDYTFEDVNKNGIQDTGDLPLAGVVVKLTKADGTAVMDLDGVVVADQTTPATGLYKFTNLPAGDYIVTFTKPTGYTPTLMDVATATDPLDSDADLATGKTGVYTLVAGDSNMTVDAGFYKPVVVDPEVLTITNSIKITDPFNCLKKAIFGTVSPYSQDVVVTLVIKNSKGEIVKTYTPVINSDGTYSQDVSDLLEGDYTNTYKATKGTLSTVESTYNFTLSKLCTPVLTVKDTNITPRTGGAVSPILTFITLLIVLFGIKKINNKRITN